MNRRDLFRLLLATPLAAVVDIEKLLWVPTPIITVPAMPLQFHPKAFSMAMEPLCLGDLFTIEDRYRVDPTSRLATRQLQQWHVVSWATGQRIAVPR